MLPVSFLLVILSVVSGCVSSADLRLNARQIAASGGLDEAVAKTSLGPVLTYRRMENPKLPLRVYLEGDGHAWVSRTQPSPDPTPLRPIGLELAAVDEWPNILYIARPCQYLGAAHCDRKWWTTARYSEPVLRAMLEVLEDYGEPRIELVGYSGGAALALLIAERYPRTANLRTVAGNLDTERFTTWHGVSPLGESLPVKLAASRIFSLNQQHFIGAADKTVPPALAESMLGEIRAGSCVTVTQLDGVTHQEGWKERWPKLLSHPFACASR